MNQCIEIREALVLSERDVGVVVHAEHFRGVVDRKTSYVLNIRLTNHKQISEEKITSIYVSEQASHCYHILCQFVCKFHFLSRCDRYVTLRSCNNQLICSSYSVCPNHQLHDHRSLYDRPCM